MNMPKDQVFYVGQKAFIDKNGEVLILLDKYGLDFPGGKIQEGETDLIAALKREVREETNMEITVGDPFVTWYFTFSNDHKYAGKKVYLVGYKCTYLSGEFAISTEHSSYRWVDKNNYKEVDDGSDYFQALKKYFEGK